MNETEIVIVCGLFFVMLVFVVVAIFRLFELKSKVDFNATRLDSKTDFIDKRYWELYHKICELEKYLGIKFIDERVVKYEKDPKELKELPK